MRTCGTHCTLGCDTNMLSINILICRYIGAWQDDKQHGRGEGFWGECNPRTGEFSNHYVGYFSNNHFSGQGAKLEDGVTYAGGFLTSRESGEGVKVWPDGRKYAGDFVDGVMAGEGAMTFRDGAKYVGEFANGLRNGSGVFTMANGHVISGQWDNDLLVIAE